MVFSSHLVIKADSEKLIYNNQGYLGAAIYVEAYVMHNPPKMTAKIFCRPNPWCGRAICP